MILVKKDIVGLLTILILPQLYLLSMNYISLVLNTRFYKLNWSNEMEVVKQSKCIFFAMLIDFVYTLILSALFIGLGLVINMLVGSIVAITFCLIMSLVSRSVLYKKGPKRISNMEL
jgi:ABC-2 type transport system permease protein